MRNSTSYIIPGTNTFRLSSKMILQVFGSNFQNWEKKVRRIYKPDKGKKFIQNDQSGAEALIVAYLCKHGQFRELFLNNIKPHVFVGLHLFQPIWQLHINKSGQGKDTRCNVQELVDLPISKLTSHHHWLEIDELIKSSDDWIPAERYYYIAKQVCHSSNYGIKAGMFCLNTLEKSGGKIVIAKRQAEAYLTFYHELFPEIRDWHYEVQQQLDSTRILYNLQGYPREFTNVDLDYKEAYAFPPQSTVACITRKAFVDLQMFIESTHVDWDLVGDCHDSYLVQCPIEEEQDCAKIMCQYMNQELVSPRGEKFKMKSELASGYNWSPYDKLHNPDGLRKLTISS